MILNDICQLYMYSFNMYLTWKIKYRVLKLINLAKNGYNRESINRQNLQKYMYINGNVILIIKQNETINLNLTNL